MIDRFKEHSLVRYTVVANHRGAVGAEKNGKEAPIWGVAQFGEMSHPGS